MFQIGATYKTYPWDARSGRCWCASVREKQSKRHDDGNKWLETSRLPRSKRSSRASWNSIFPCTSDQVRAGSKKFRPTLKPVEVSSRSKSVVGHEGKEGGTGQHLSQNPSTNEDAVCWGCGKKGHSSTECWSNPKKQSGSGGGQQRRQRKTREQCWQGSGLRGTKRSSGSCRAAATKDSCELSGLGIVLRNPKDHLTLSRRLLEMDMQHGCGDLGFSTMRRVHRNGGERVQVQDCVRRTHP